MGRYFASQRSVWCSHLWLVLVLSGGLIGCGAPEGDEDEEAQEDSQEESEVELGEPSDAELPNGDVSEDSGDEESTSSQTEDVSPEASSPEPSETPEPEPESESEDASEDQPKPKGDGPKEDICNETVPAKHYVDDIPAYSQCAESLNAKIWSKDGISTATSQKGDGWVPTQWGGGYQCTEFAKRYMYFRFGVKKFPNGNAGVWCEGTTPEGLEKTTEPVHGDLIVFAPGSCGASLATGHVGVVDKVDLAKKSVEFVEQNQANRRVCAISTAACFLHAKKNK